MPVEAYILRNRGRQCPVEGYEGLPQECFNCGRDDNTPYTDTVRKMDVFFVSLGWLKGEPTI